MEKLTLHVDELAVESFVVPTAPEETTLAMAVAANEPFIIVSCFCSADC